MTDTSRTLPALSSAAGTRVLGAELIVGSAALFGLAGVFTKSVSADAWTIACWRGIIGGLVIALYVLWRGWRSGAGVDLRLGWRGWLMAAVGAASSLTFIAAFKHTYVANVAIIYATVPMVAAGLEWLLMRVKPSRLTVGSALVSFAGVGIIVAGGLGAGHLVGDLIAVAMTLACAVYMVLIRLFRETPVVWAGAVSAFILFAAAWLVVDPLAVSTADMVKMAGFGLAFACAAILWTEGTRLIPAAEAGVLGSAEVPFAMVFAWLFLSELPPVPSLAGGLVVLTAVVLHAVRSARAG